MLRTSFIFIVLYWAFSGKQPYRTVVVYFAKMIYLTEGHIGASRFKKVQLRNAKSYFFQILFSNNFLETRKKTTFLIVIFSRQWAVQACFVHRTPLIFVCILSSLPAPHFYQLLQQRLLLREWFLAFYAFPGIQTGFQTLSINLNRIFFALRKVLRTVLKMIQTSFATQPFSTVIYFDDNLYFFI